MVISSSEIAQLNGAYAGIAQNQMAYAAQIGQGANVYGGGYQGQRGDRAMSSAMNMAGAVGGPLMAGAMGLAGLDPMSIGLRAGMGAYGAGMGFGGAAMAGAAVALPLMAAGSAVSYAGGQMYNGAQQQMGLNQQLRQGFNFQNQQGGQGFNRSDMTSIGGMVREMSSHFGPGGEIASFKELSGLAGRMASMGFAQGVKDVKDFSDRFKEMVKAIKTMATDLGTTLEGAMEFAQAAKSSGVFGMPRIQAFTAAAAKATAGGGIALSEVTGAASIGSQISRSMGGLGRQGAAGGIQTIQNIKSAQQLGLISEEDIYNVTGLTGAEGRQAYAASQMSSSAHFLQSGKGRRFLASIAGKNGTLDEEAVQQVLTGGMGVAETMANDRSHVTGPGAPVNRANFIRNEGRLRGAAFERFGGNIETLQMMQWARSKGVDVSTSEGHDRAMLFMQRQLGMGRDQADVAVTEALNLPQIMMHQAREEQQQNYFNKLAQSRKGQGIEGVQQRFDQAKSNINNKLQKAGQDILNQGSESIDSFWNNLFGTYVETYSKTIEDDTRRMMQGDSRVAQRAFGIGGSGLDKRLAREGTSVNLQGHAKMGLRAAMDYGGGLTGADSSFMFGESGATTLRKRGISIAGMNDAQIQSHLTGIEAMQAAAATGLNDPNITVGGQADFLRKAYATKEFEGLQNDARLKATNALINRTASGAASDPNTVAAQALQRAMYGKSGPERANLIGNYERMQEATGGSLSSHMGLGEGGMAAILAKQGPGGFSSIREQNLAFADAMGLHKEHGWREKLSEGKSSKDYTDLELKQGAYISGDDFRNVAQGLFSSDSMEVAKAQKDMQNALAAPGGDKDINDVNRRVLHASEFMSQHIDSKSIAEQEAWAAKNAEGMTVEDLHKTAGGAGAVVHADQQKAREKAREQLTAMARDDSKVLRSMGVMNASDGTLTSETAASLTKKFGAAGGKQAADYMSIVLSQTKMESEGDLEGSYSYAAIAAGALEKLSVGQKRSVAAKLGSIRGGEAGFQGSIQDRIQHSRRDNAGTTADILGLKMSSQDLAEFGGDASKIAANFSAGLGVAGNDRVQGLLRESLTSKDSGHRAHLLASVMEDKDVQTAAKKKKDDSDEADHPIETAIQKNTKQTAELLDKLLRVQVAMGGSVAKMAAADPEQKTVNNSGGWAPVK